MIFFIKRFFTVLVARNKEFLRDHSALGWNLLFPILVIFGFAYAFSSGSQDVFKVAWVSNEEKVSTEQEFEKILQEHHIAYEKNYRIGNRLYDFVVGSYVIEIDGPYHREYMFHGDQTMTIEQRKVLLEKIKLRDAIKTQIAINHGYKVFRIDVGNKLPDNWYEVLKIQGWDIF